MNDHEAHNDLGSRGHHHHPGGHPCGTGTPSTDDQHPVIIKGFRPAVKLVYAPSSGLLMVGISQLGVACLIGILSILAVFLLPYAILSQLVWAAISTSIYVLIMGIICVLTARKPKRALVIATVVLSVIACVGIWWLIIESILTVVTAAHFNQAGWIGVSSVLLLAGIAELVLAIAGATLPTRMHRSPHLVEDRVKPGQTVAMTTAMAASVGFPAGQTSHHHHQNHPSPPNASEFVQSDHRHDDDIIQGERL